jgi:hypothetical protein
VFSTFVSEQLGQGSLNVRYTQLREARREGDVLGRSATVYVGHYVHNSPAVVNQALLKMRITKMTLTMCVPLLFSMMLHQVWPTLFQDQKTSGSALKIVLPKNSCRSERLERGGPC